MTPARILREAAINRRKAQRLREDAALRLAMATTLEGQAADLEALAGTTATHLHKGRDLSIVGKSNMDNSHRLAISRSRSRAAPRDPFSIACRKANLTRGGLARAIGIDPALLSRYRKGTRPIPQERADRIKAIMGWPADKAHWPGGIVPLD